MRFTNNMLNWFKNKKKKLDIEPVKKESRLDQMKRNPYKRVDSENMTDIKKWIKDLMARLFL